MRKKKIISGFEDINIVNPKDKKSLYNSIKMDSRCPRGLKTLPTEPCSQALNSIYQQGLPCDKCEWYVVHADSNYCFFAYQHLNTKVHTLDEIASLLNSTITSVDLQAKRALDKLKKRFKTKQELLRYFEKNKGSISEETIS